MVATPHFPEDPLPELTELILTDEPNIALQALLDKGLINSEQKSLWLARMLQAEGPARRGLTHWRTRVHLGLEKKLENSGHLSATNPFGILTNLLNLGRLEDVDRFQFPRISEEHILDFGCGVFYSLSTAAVLHANGFRRVTVCEPFTLCPELVVASLENLTLSILRDPSKFNFSGIAPEQLKHRLITLPFDTLKLKLERFIDELDDVLVWGPIQLVKNLTTLDEDSLDLVFSNSVLEHVEDLPGVLAQLRKKLRSGGLSLHTVDFADHRCYEQPGLHLFEMYYDGVVEQITGIRPDELEAVFSAQGFTGHCYSMIKAPDIYSKSDSRPLHSRFEKLPARAHQEWVCGYRLI